MILVDNKKARTTARAWKNKTFSFLIPSFRLPSETSAQDTLSPGFVSAGAVDAPWQTP